PGLSAHDVPKQRRPQSSPGMNRLDDEMTGRNRVCSRSNVVTIIGSHMGPKVAFSIPDEEDRFSCCNVKTCSFLFNTMNYIVSPRGNSRDRLIDPISS